MTDADKLAALKEPFAAADVEWRIGSSGATRDGKPWAKCLAYITNRGVMNRLDEVFGIGGWKNEFRQVDVKSESGFICGLSVKLDDGWVTKWDGAPVTDIESIKGGISDSMKRAAVQLGLGRYLYDLEEGWATVHGDGPHKTDGSRGRYYSKFKDGNFYSWDPPALPNWAKRKDEQGVVPPRPAAAPPAAATANPPPAGSPEQAPAAPPAPGLADQQKAHDEKELVKRAIAKCALSGTKPDLEAISDFADSLTEQGKLSKTGREEINKAVKNALKRIDEVAKSPHNPENKS